MPEKNSPTRDNRRAIFKGFIFEMEYVVKRTLENSVDNNIEIENDANLNEGGNDEMEN